MALQHLRSSTAHKRPIPTQLSAGQIAVNTNEASPGLFFKDSNGDLVKIGPVHVGENAPNSSPASTAATAIVSGTTYQILTVGTTDFTAIGASANTVGVIFTATGVGTGTGTVSGQQGVEKGEQWLDTTGGTYVLKIYDGSAWRSESGTFVDSAGDTMTGALLLDNAASASAPDLSFDGDANTGIYSPGADEVAIATGGVGRLFIDGNGDVKIEDTSADSAAGPEFSLYRNSASPADGDYLGQIRFDGENDTGGKKLYAKITGKTSDVSNGSEDGLIETAVIKAGSQTIVSRQTGTDLKLINGTGLQVDGDVGIGTTSPSQELSVNGNAILLASGELLFADGTNQQTASIKNGASSNTSQLQFFTSAAERLRIDSSGNVGIGTSSPGQKLDVAGSINLTGNQVFSTTTSPFIVANAASSVLRFGTVGTERLRIDSSGNVGIGTASPATVLNTFGTSSQEIRMSTNTAGDARLGFDLQGAFYNWIESLRTGGAMRFAVGNSEALRIDSSGRVGINASSPGRTLDVDGVIRSDGTSGAFALGGNSSTPSEGCAIHRPANNTMAFVTGNSERMRISSSGNVGIGTNNPLAALEVHDSDTALTLRDTSDYVAGTGPRINFQGKDSNGLNKNLASIHGVSRSSNNGDLVFKTRTGGNTYERVRIDMEGRVGIGTSNPGDYNLNANQLVVGNTSSACGITIASSTTNTGNIFFADGTSGGAQEAAGYVQYDHAGNFLRFGTGNAERIRIDSSGNIGLINGHIDTTSGSSARCYVSNSGFIYIARSAGPVALFNRNTNDGDVVLIRQGNANEGSISVSGSTVSYNGAHLSRWSQLPGGAGRTEILRGSVLSNIDEMCEWGEEDNEQLNRMQVSDTEGDRNVSGVFQCWDDDDDTYTNDFYCAMTGDFVIRIAQGTTVARGDLLMSAGDGTAKPQDDDIVRSKTIAKVTSTTVSTTYSDGSYCVPCVLMAC